MTGDTRQRDPKHDLLLRDYSATWLLGSIASRLGENLSCLLLRGGAALRYLYYPNARLTPDLDFALCGEVGPVQFGSLLAAACFDAQVASATTYKLTRDKENPGAGPGTVARSWSVACQPYGSARPAHPPLRISVGWEKVLSDPVPLSLLPRYPGLPRVAMPAYALEELVAEKLQALVPGPKPLRPYAAGRKYARHLYDTWFILIRAELDMVKLPDLFRAKCKRRGLTPKGAGELLNERHVVSYRAGWPRLSRLTVEPLPELETVLAEFEALTLRLSYG